MVEMDAYGYGYCRSVAEWDTCPLPGTHFDYYCYYYQIITQCSNHLSLIQNLGTLDLIWTRRREKIRYDEQHHCAKSRCHGIVDGERIPKLLLQL